MLYGKMKNNQVEYVTDGGLPVVETPPPSTLEYGFKAVSRYEQWGDQIVKIWEVVPWSEQEWQEAERKEVAYNGEQKSEEQEAPDANLNTELVTET